MNFATGSNDSYYINSLCKSQTSFEIVQKSDINNTFGKKILLLDDLKKSLTSERVGVYVRFVRDKQICDIDTWSNRNVLKEKVAI